MPTSHVRVPASEAESLVAVLHDAEGDDQLIHAALRDPDNQAYGAWHDDELVGAAVVRWRTGLTSEILYIAVREGHRGNGHGRALIQHLISELPGHGNRLVVGTANSSLDNIAFYQHCGFRMDAVKRDHFGYVQPESSEFGIPTRDMIVFAYEPPEGPPETAKMVPVESESEADRIALDGVRFLLIPGSTRLTSSNHAVLRTMQSFTQRSVLFEGLADLPQFNPDDDTSPSNAVVTALRDQIAGADIVVFCTPEYAGTLPGSFKNLVDWTVGHSDLYKKPVAWINVAAPGRGGGATNDLARVLGYVDAKILEPGGVRLSLPSGSIGPDGTVTDPGYRARLRQAVAGLAHVHLAARESNA